jgi:hypothetical protein
MTDLLENFSRGILPLEMRFLLRRRIALRDAHRSIALQGEFPLEFRKSLRKTLWEMLENTANTGLPIRLH